MTEYEQSPTRIYRKPEQAEVDIFILSFQRLRVLETVVRGLQARTKTPFRLHIFDNGSDGEIQRVLIDWFYGGLASLHLESENTRPYYPKRIHHAAVTADRDFYVVTDSDIEPPALGEHCWLTRMLEIMRSRPKLAVLAAQVPPVWLQKPYLQDHEVVYCHAVGNTLKLVRRTAVDAALRYMPQEKGKFGDDTILCEALHRKGWLVGYTKNIFCHNLGQMENWGYEPGEEQLDPRKKDELPPVYIKPTDMYTFETDEEHQYVPGGRFQNGAPVILDAKS